MSTIIEFMKEQKDLVKVVGQTVVANDIDVVCYLFKLTHHSCSCSGPMCIDDPPDCR